MLQDTCRRPQSSAAHLEPVRVDSFLMVDKITTIRRSNAHAVIARLQATTLIEFDRRLLVFHGFSA